jgi:hypothetical protein
LRIKQPIQEKEALQTKIKKMYTPFDCADLLKEFQTARVDKAFGRKLNGANEPWLADLATPEHALTEC